MKKTDYNDVKGINKESGGIPDENISCELHPSHVESHMCISDVTCVKNSRVRFRKHAFHKP